jgi:hypothetical protein
MPALDDVSAMLPPTTSGRLTGRLKLVLVVLPVAQFIAAVVLAGAVLAGVLPRARKDV